MVAGVEACQENGHVVGFTAGVDKVSHLHWASTGKKARQDREPRCTCELLNDLTPECVIVVSSSVVF